MNSFPKGILRFCRIVSGLPLECTLGTKGMKTLRFSMTGFLWGATLVLFQQVLSVIGLYREYLSSLDGPSDWKMDMTTMLTAILDVVSLQVMAAVLFFSSTWKYPRLVDVCNTLEKVYRSLQQTKLKIKVIDKAIVVCAYTFLLALTIVDHVMYYDELFIKVLSVILYLPTLLFYCAQLAFYVHFTHVVQSITKGFNIVNAKIKEEITSHVFERVAIYNINRSNGEVTYPTCDNGKTIQQIKILLNIYWLLCDAVHKANNFYCVQLLAVVFSSFIHITITSYFFFVRITQYGDLFVTATLGIWALAHICYVVLLMATSTDVTDSAEQSAPIICNLINKDLDPNLREQLEMFLLQMPHHNATFSALGFFQIHNKTLTAMAGAVATYLVVLIQFQSNTLST